jgi:hypothetical protein
LKLKLRGNEEVILIGGDFNAHTNTLRGADVDGIDEGRNTISRGS